MKNLVFLVLLALPLLASAQESSSKPSLPPLPDYTYITPDMSKKQIDSLILALGYYDLELSFDTLEYDENNKIKRINGALYNGDEYFLVSSAKFKGMTIIKRGPKSVAVVMGLFQPKK